MVVEFRVLERTFELHWEVTSNFAADPQRRRCYDSILDFGCWRTEVDLVAIDAAMKVFSPWPTSTPLIIAGKPEGPDMAALALAVAVLENPSKILSRFRTSFPDFKLGADDWMLRALSIPYQTFGSCWFLAFETEYDGQESYVVKQDATNVVISIETEYSSGFPTSLPSIVRQCIWRLREYALADKEFDDLLNRIQYERIFGPEIVSQLRRVIDRSISSLPEHGQKHMQHLLDQLMRKDFIMGSTSILNSFISSQP